MSFSQESTTKKLISAPVVVSSFMGMTVAALVAFGMQASMNVSALQQANQATSQVNTVEDFAKFAYAYNQGYEARVTSASSSEAGGQAACSSVEVSAAPAAESAQVNSIAAPVGGKGGGGAAAKMSDRTAAMVNSYNSYTSMVNNSSSVTNVNSNNTVGSNNSTQTDISVERSMGVVVGVENKQTGTQMNASDSFNRDSYNTTNETSIVNDSYNRDVDVTNTTTTTNTVTNTVNTDVDVHREVNIDNTRNITNTDNSVSNNNSNNDTSFELEIETTEVAINSYNEED